MVSSRQLGKLGLAIVFVILAIAGLIIYKGQTTQPFKVGGKPQVIRIGYFANLTHAPALIAHQKRLFQHYLPGIRIETTTFSVGTAEVEALKGGALDVGYMGPGPAIGGYTTTQGTLLNVISGAATNGAMLVVRPSLIAKPGFPTTSEIKALAGKNLADPGLGGTQDVAMRSFFKGQGMWRNGVPSANILPMANADTLALFQQGKLDGAWVPEPWGTRLIHEGGAKLFVDERTLWPNGKFSTTVMVATQKFIRQYPGSVRGLVQANQAALDFLSQSKNKTEAISLVQRELQTATGKTLTPSVISASWNNLTFESDPVVYSIKHDFENAAELGQLPNTGLSGIRGIFKLDFLNQIRKNTGLGLITVPENLK